MMEMYYRKMPSWAKSLFIKGWEQLKNPVYTAVYFWDQVCHYE